MMSFQSDIIAIQIDLGKFEELIADLSHAVVLFPEAPGSFAETGYFSKTESVANKTILVMNANFQKDDSFIMLGPAKLFDIHSKFNPQIQMDYNNPNFDDIIDRINRFKKSITKKVIDPKNYDGPYDLFCIIYKIIDLLRIATIDDVTFVANSIMNGHAPRRQIKELFSILIGSKFIHPIGDYGHHYCVGNPMLVETREGFLEHEIAVKMQVTESILTGDAELSLLLEGIAHAA